MLRILQARIHSTWRFRKDSGTTDQIANICWIIEKANIWWIIQKAREFKKKSTFASLTMLKPLNVWITINHGKFLRKWENQTILSASWETCMQVKKQQLEPDMEQWSGSKLGKEYIKAAYCHPAYLTYMPSTSYEMLGWMTHKLESRLLGEISIISDTWMTPL